MGSIKKNYIPTEQSMFLIGQALKQIGFYRIGHGNYRDDQENRVFICEVANSHGTLIMEYEGTSALFSELEKKLPSKKS